MKSISGKVTSTKPISLSKAAKVLSGFISTADDAASKSVAVYLRRASDAFNELVQLHKELKDSPFNNCNLKGHVKPECSLDSRPSRRESITPDSRQRKKHRAVDVKRETPVKMEQNSDEAGAEGLKHAKLSNGNVGDEKPISIEHRNGQVEVVGSEHVEIGERKKIKKNKRKNNMDDGVDLVGEEHERKENKKRKNREVDDGDESVAEHSEPKAHQKKKMKVLEE